MTYYKQIWQCVKCKTTAPYESIKASQINGLPHNPHIKCTKCNGVMRRTAMRNV